MKVVTLNREDFRRACQRLFLEVMAEEFWPDVLVGIAHGGEEVMNCLASDFPEARIASVKCSRPTSRNKKFLSPVLRYLPSRINIVLRRLEARFLNKHTDTKRTLENHLDPKLFYGTKRPKVLIVDDAVDSGHTLKTVEQEVRRVCPDAIIRTAALTVTTIRPICRPNIVLYKDLTLIRFPWSADTKDK